jgi:O-antigen ligase
MAYGNGPYNASRRHSGNCPAADRVRLSTVPVESRAVVNALSAVHTRPRLVDNAWPLWFVFGLYPLWWALGLTFAVWGMACALLVVHFIGQPAPRWPAAFGLWLLFLGWTAVSLSQINDADRLLAYVYRGGSLAAATLLFLYIYNRHEDRLPTALAVRIMALFWCVIAVGGLIAVIYPTLRFATPMEFLLPESMTRNNLISALVHPRAAQLSRILGFPVGRPVMPFAFTNAWGANYALTLPFLVLSWRYCGRRWRLVTCGIAIASVVPLVLSLDRGVWISLGVGMLYASGRLAAARRGRSLIGVVVAAGVIATILIITPLGQLIISRAEHGHSDSGRADLYTEAVQITKESPVFGYGAPQPSQEGSDKPSVGTHGQFWLVLVSTGVPGLVFFLLWYAYMAVSTRRRRDPVAFWCHIVIVVALVQLPFYEQSHAPMCITMVAAALALRNGSPPPSIALAAKRAPATAGVDHSVGSAKPNQDRS